VSLHNLRHTAATLLLAQGGTVKDVQGILGHEKADITLNVYAKMVEGNADALMEVYSIG
jgi:integrase